jgi:outer membrane receptor protein involved in Fe transport
MLMALALPGRVSGQDVTPEGGAFARLASSGWVTVRSARVPPLQRTITLDLNQVTVRQAIGEIARRGHFPIGYGDDVVHTKARVSLKAEGLTIAEALTAALQGTGLEAYVSLVSGAVVVRAAPPQVAPAQAGSIAGRVTDAKTQTALAGATVSVSGTNRSVTTGSDGRYRLADVAPGTYTVRARYIGYAPGSVAVTVTADQEATADFTLARSVQKLDEVVTTGTVVESQVKTLPSPITVIKAEDIQRLGITRTDQIFRGSVPGAVALDDGQSDGYPAIAFRGGTDFNQSVNNAPYKVYIDGVEIAYNNVISQLDPSMIERIEIVRGPQASTIYGSGAIIGVIQVFTKKGGTAGGPPMVNAKAGLGFLKSQWADGSTTRQEYSLSATGGDRSLSYNLGGSLTELGAWVPEYQSTSRALFGSARKLAGPLTVEVSANYSDRRYDSRPVDPFTVQQVQAGRWNTGFNGFYTAPFYPDITRLEGTTGLNLIYQTAPWWEQRLTLGYDAFTNPRDQTAPRNWFPGDTLRPFSEFQTTRASLVYNTTLTARPSELVRASLTLGFDGQNSKERIISGSRDAEGLFVGDVFARRSDFTNRGYYAQGQIALREQLFLTAGLRADDNSNFGGDYGTAIAPRFGAAYTQEVGAATLKFRGSWGKAIMPPFSYQKNASKGTFDEQLANPDLGPQTQSGFDVGAELYAGAVGLQATYYDQRVEGVISSVTVSDPGALIPQFVFRNLGRIRNKGWEFQGTARHGVLSLLATYSIFNSTAEELVPGGLGTDRGQYLPGDRLLAIPRSSGGLTLSYSRGRTQATVGGTYIGSFRNYDYVSANDAQFGGGTFTQWRDYIIDYPAFTKWNLSVSQGLRGQLGIFARAENLFDSQASETYNTAAVYGRLVVAGFTWGAR